MFHSLGMAQSTTTNDFTTFSHISFQRCRKPIDSIFNLSFFQIVRNLYLSRVLTQAFDVLRFRKTNRHMYIYIYITN